MKDLRHLKDLTLTFNSDVSVAFQSVGQPLLFCGRALNVSEGLPEGNTRWPCWFRSGINAPLSLKLFRYDLAILDLPNRRLGIAPCTTKLKTYHETQNV